MQTQHLRRMSVQVLLPLAIVIGGLATVWAYAHPGFMSYDSCDQLRQARAGIYSDWQPPAMAALWRLVDRIVEGPFGMLVVQTTVFAIGAYLWFRRVLSRVVAAACTSGLLVFPPIATTLGVIWKDSQMLSYLVLGSVLLASPRRRVRLSGLGVLLLASLMRHNAPAITLPLIVILWRWSDATARGVRRYLAAVATWFAITLVALLINSLLTTNHAHPWSDAMAPHDIAGILRYAPAIPDDEARSYLEGTPVLVHDDVQLRAITAYNPTTGVLGLTAHGFMTMPATDAERSALARAWWRLVRAHPGAYLWHRWRIFRELLMIPRRAHEQIWVGYDDACAELVPAEPRGPVQAWFVDRALWLGRSWLFHVYLYALAVIAFVVLAVRERNRELIALGTSALVSELAYFFFAPAADFRYSVWLVPVAIIMAVQLFVRRMPRGGTR